MVSKQAMVLGVVAVGLSAAVMAADNGWDYSTDDALPFAGTRQQHEPRVRYRFSSDDPMPRVSVDNRTRDDTTGNLSIDNDVQQEAERCNRLRDQQRSKDANKLNC